MDSARFIKAQQSTYDQARRELLAGAKASHWIWYIFPQLAALGHSDPAKFYGLTTLEDARQYMADPILAARLVELTAIVLGHRDKSVRAIFGSPDDMKFRSSMTLFALAAPQHPEFRQAIAAFYDGPDQRTLDLLGADYPNDHPALIGPLRA